MLAMTMELEQTKEQEKLTTCGRAFHKLGLFLMKRSFGQQVGLFLRAVASIFSESRSFKTDSRNVILQTFFTGVEIFPVLFVVATLFGAIVIVEIMTMMGKVGFSDVVGSLMVVVIIRHSSLRDEADLRSRRTWAAWSSIPKSTHLPRWA